jgi:hypothetical protein
MLKLFYGTFIAMVFINIILLLVTIKNFVIPTIIKLFKNFDGEKSRYILMAVVLLGATCAFIIGEIYLVKAMIINIFS